MIPLRDNVPSKKVPFINYIFIAINIVVFIFELSLGDGLEGFFYRFGVVPAYVTAGTYGLRYEVLPIFTSMFLHGGFLHVGGNMLFLWIFGDNVEDRMGHFLYVLFYLGSGIGASLLHIAVDPQSQIPTVGASGAIAGVMGAYFILYPRARVLSAVIIFYFIRLMEIPAIVFLGIWFVLQFFTGVLSIGATAEATGGVAVWAHVGGFIVGIAGGLITKLLTGKGRQPVEVITRDGKRYWH